MENKLPFSYLTFGKSWATLFIESHRTFIYMESFLGHEVAILFAERMIKSKL